VLNVFVHGAVTALRSRGAESVLERVRPVSRDNLKNNQIMILDMFWKHTVCLFSLMIVDSSAENNSTGLFCYETSLLNEFALYFPIIPHGRHRNLQTREKLSSFFFFCIIKLIFYYAGIHIQNSKTEILVNLIHLECSHFWRDDYPGYYFM